ncbi:MAG: ABC transporter ATP-binding protein [Pseudomonadota bacterium]
MFEKLVADLQGRMIVRLVRENFRLQVFNYSVAIVAMVVIAAMAALTAWIMQDIIDTMIASEDRMQAFVVAGAVALIFSVKGFATYVQMVFMSRAGNSIVAYQQRRLYHRILQQGVAFFNDSGSHDLLMRVIYSAQGSRTVIQTLVTGFVRDLLTLVGLIAVMIYQQPTLTIFAFVFGPLALFGVRRILKRVKKIMQSQMTSLAEIIRVVQETSTGVRVVKAFSLEDHMGERMKGAVKAVEKRANAIARLEAATSPLMETLAGFAIAAIVALSAVNLFGQQANSPGQLMSFITALMMAYEPAKRLARMRVTIETGMIMVGLMYTTLDQPISVEEAEDAFYLPENVDGVTFEDVKFDYNNGQPILNNLNIAFEAGKTTALVGPSGGGKSTIINLIMRMYDPTSGAVKIGGNDLRDVTFASLREKIAFVGQDTFLFSGTVRQNIALGREDASSAEIVAAAKSANAHDFIMDLERGYETTVGENGSHLSGGQRQRVAIARAILRDSPILLMDEATSALDSESEHLVKEALAHLSKDRTTIVIAHRLATVVNADKIIVIEKGAVAEEGKLPDLLSHNGLFKKLYDHQYNPNPDLEPVDA